MDNKILSEIAPAKVNLGLNIVGKREDGYHEMEMINHSVDLADTLTLIPGETEFVLESAFGGDFENLITKAVRLLEERTGKQADFRIVLDKKIPHQAGLGGGSADAAAALRLVERYWGLELPEEERTAIAAKLGADVPYCLYNKSAYVTGIGEKLEFMELKIPEYLLIVKPEVGVATEEAFAWADAEEDLTHPDLKKYLKTLDEKDLDNSFYPVICSHYPEIEVLREEIKSLGAETAVMSGSGSTLVGYFSDPKERDRAYDKLSARKEITLHRSRILE